MAFCKNCGKQLNDSAKFCGGCGTQVSKQQSRVTTRPPKVISPKEKRARKIKIVAALIIFAILSVPLWFVYDAREHDTRWYRKNRNAKTFSISTADELAGLAKIVNGTWKDEAERDNFADKTITITEDIDLSVYDNWVPIGDYTTDSNNIFSGTFNGDGHIIKGLTINRLDDDRQGLFGRIDGANIQNLGFDNVDIKGRSRVGTVAGVANKKSSITNCHSAGIVSGMAMVGGIAGSITGNSGIAESYSTSAINGEAAVGGVVGGVNFNSSVANSYSSGTVNGNEGVGGVAGSVLESSSVTNSYSTGTVSGNDEVGGVAGQILSQSSLINSYFTGTINGNNRVGGIVGGVYKSQVSNSYSTGTVSGNEGVGGVVGGVYEGQVNNNYSIGAVNGRDGVGGIVGGVRASTVVDCAALNPEIKGSGNIGRVFSNSWNNSKPSSNIAYNEMTNNAGNSKWVNIGDNKRDGVNITIAAIRADGTIGGRFTTDKGWYVQKGSLPGIGKPMAMPAHLSAKAETDCIDGEVWENNICKTLEELKTANTDTTQVEQENREETQEEAQAQVKTETQAETKVLVKTEDPLESEAPEELDQ